MKEQKAYFNRRKTPLTKEISEINREILSHFKLKDIMGFLSLILILTFLLVLV